MKVSDIGSQAGKSHVDFPAFVTGMVYGVSMFVAGCLMGAFRVLYLEPRFGDWISFWIEVPIMLHICWYLSIQVLMSWHLIHLTLNWSDDANERKIPSNVDIIGISAFMILVGLEIAMEMGILHKTFSETKEDLFTSRIGTAGLTIQLIACSFPIFQDTLKESYPLR